MEEEQVLAGPFRQEAERLAAENVVLRQRLATAESVARERQERIDDLLAALQRLPAAWVEQLVWTEDRPPAGDGSEQSERAEAAGAASEEDIVEAEWEEVLPSGEPAEALDPEELARAMASWAEVRRLRDRLEDQLLAKQSERRRARGARRRSA